MSFMGFGGFVAVNGVLNVLSVEYVILAHLKQVSSLIPPHVLP